MNTSDKLGLAFAGGGFRASLFHVGVLHRLAELDVLRHVQVLSTVSGGSITGAVYVLRLKQWLENKGPRLTRQDYIQLVGEVDDILCRGIEKNLRTRLLLNPFRIMRVMLTQDSLGRAMARLYEHHMFQEAIQRKPGEAWNRDDRKQSADLDLGQLRIRPGGVAPAGGIDAYNANEEMAEDGSVITSIVINATTLNSGGRFSFSGVELGDWYLGYFRRDEVEDLRALRDLLHMPLEDLRKKLHDAEATAMLDPDAAHTARRTSLALWWRRRVQGETPAPPSGWERLFDHPGSARFPGDLTEAALGHLRRAKLAAWYLLYGHAYQPPITGGRTKEALWLEILAVLGEIDRELARNLRVEMKQSDPAAALLLEFIIDLYLVRSADRMSDRFEKDWESLSVSDAVGASACFPPVFPPFVLLGIYDDAHVTRLGLTDGGAYDNVGTVGLLDEGCTSVIASDTGGVFDELAAAPAGHVGMSLRLPSILMRALGSFQHLALRERKRVSRELIDIAENVPDTPDCDEARNLLDMSRAAREINDLAYFQIASAPPVLPKEHAKPLDLQIDPDKIARLRTDLDCFGQIEIAALVNQGYDNADRFARGFMQRYAKEWWSDAKPVAPKPLVRTDRAEQILDAGAARFLRAVAVRAPVTLVALALAAAGLILGAAMGLTLTKTWSLVHSAIYAMPPFTRWIPEVVVPAVWNVLVHPVAIGVAGALLLLKALGSLVPPRARTSRRKFLWLTTARKWASSYSGNLGWFLWALPLLVSFTLMVITAIAWVLFYLPWRARAAIGPNDVEAGPHTSAVNRENTRIATLRLL